MTYKILRFHGYWFMNFKILLKYMVIGLRIFKFHSNSCYSKSLGFIDFVTLLNSMVIGM